MFVDKSDIAHKAMYDDLSGYEWVINLRDEQEMADRLLRTTVTPVIIPLIDHCRRQLDVMVAAIVGAEHDEAAFAARSHLAQRESFAVASFGPAICIGEMR